MFYSTEILTSRKYGVATVWLVATLGSKSSLKKVNRKAILSVDVSKACETILSPAAPMALRLQSNLLYGVSRVYNEQCSYVLSDLQAAQNNLRTLFRVVQSADVDMEPSRVRPEQLVLQDDPSFLPEIELARLDLDFMDLGITALEESQLSTALSPGSRRSGRSSQSSKIADLQIGGFGDDTSVTGGPGGIGGYSIQGDDNMFGEAVGGVFSQHAPPGQLEEADFLFDEDGNLVEVAVGPEERVVAGPVTPGPRLASEGAASARVRDEHWQGQQFPENLAADEDFNLPPIDNDLGELPDAEAYLEVAGEPTLHSARQQHSAAEVEMVTSSATSTPNRRRRAIKTLPRDTRTELRNSDISAWNTRYLENMAKALGDSLKHRGPALAKRNAFHWVFGTGIGGIGTDGDNPLSMFSGERLLVLLTESNVGQKRDRDESESGSTTDSETRRLRARGEDGQPIVRGGPAEVEDEGILPVIEDDGIEFGRDAASVMGDVSSAMPWNVLGSVRGSSVARGLGLGGSQAGAPTSASRMSSAFRAGPLARRASRTVSPSPLQRRAAGRKVDVIPSSDAMDNGDDGFVLPGMDAEGDTRLDDFELYGPAAEVSTQTAAQSRWARDALDQEGNNFLGFVETALEQKRDGQAGDVDAAFVTFEELLPPASNSVIVAAQGFLHTLGLGTKRMLKIEQDVPFGEIRLQPLTAARI